MRFIVLPIILLLAACSPQSWNDRLTTPQERGLAQRVIAMVRSDDVNGLRAVADSALLQQLTPQALRPIVRMMPTAGQPSLQVVAVNTLAIDSAPRTVKVLYYEVGADKQWALVQVTLVIRGARTRLGGFHVQPSALRPTTFNDFTFAGKPAINYAWLAMMAVAIVVTILGAVTAFRSPHFRKLRWLWIVGSLFSFVTFSLNWATSAFGVMPVSFLLLGAGAMRGNALSPWIVSFAIPVVAIVILVLDRVERQRQAEGDDYAVNEIV
jgi:heme exporter protein D